MDSLTRIILYVAWLTMEESQLFQESNILYMYHPLKIKWQEGSYLSILYCVCLFVCLSVGLSKT